MYDDEDDDGLCSNGVPIWVYEEHPNFDLNELEDNIAEMNKEVEEYNKMTELQKIVFDKKKQMEINKK